MFCSKTSVTWLNPLMSQNPKIFMFLLPGINGLKSSPVPSRFKFVAIICAPASPKQSPRSLPIFVKLVSKISVSYVALCFFFLFLDFSCFFYNSSSKIPIPSLGSSLQSFIGFFWIILILSIIHSIGVTTKLDVSLLK